MGMHNKKRISYGGSMIIDPWGRILAECEAIDDDATLKRLQESEEGGDGEVSICTAEVDLTMLERIRREVPMKRR